MSNIPIKLEEILLKDLKIDEYQRPYEWAEKHLNILMNDLLLFVYKNDEQYIIGNIIVHKSGNNRFIVDGQQRMVSLHILLFALGDKEYIFLQQKFNNISKDFIISNFTFLKKWLRRFNEVEKQYFLENLKRKVYFFYIEVNTLEEAFQLFDSQNTRGQSLKPTDLLKAFHLQKMSKDISEEEKRNYVDRWEELSRGNKLNHFIENHLFRIRSWVKGNESYNFENTDVFEFKGINLKVDEIQLFARKEAIAYFSCKKIASDNVYAIFNDQIQYPFQIDQVIINGENFFDYVFQFYEEFERILNGQNAFAVFYKKYCKDYNGWRRIGDSYLRTLFENFSFYAITRFSAKEYELYFKKVYRNFYFPRVKSDGSRITINKIFCKIDWFSKSSYHLDLSFIEQEEDYFDDNLPKENGANTKANEHIKKVYKRA